MAQDMHCHPQREERKCSKEILDQDWKPAGQTPNSASPCLMSKCSSDLQLHSALLTATHFFLLDFFHSLLAVFLGRYPTTLASTIVWGLQGNLGSTFRASCNGLSRLPFRDSPDMPGLISFPSLQRTITITHFFIFKTRTRWLPKLPSSAAYYIWNMTPLLITSSLSSCFLMISFTDYAWLSWNWIYRPGWPWT